MKHFSKSNYLEGLRCPKLIWTISKAKHLMPSSDAAAQAIFDQGHEVGALAKKLFTNSIEIGQGVDGLDELVRLTQEDIKTRKPLFEAAFSYKGGYARADVLNPVDGDAWDLIEVKSSTSVKDVYISDLAFQAFVMTGLKIRRCILLLINPDFVRHGEIDPDKFFVRHDVTDQVWAVFPQIEAQIAEMFATIRLEDTPNMKIGPHCDSPYTCPLHAQCWSFLPNENVLELYRGAKKGFKLLANGISQIKDIPEEFPLTENQEIQRQVARARKPHVNKTAISAFLQRLEYPISYLDFETFSTAIPMFDHTRPYEQVPFQFSLHIVRAPGNQPEHHMFLADGPADPRLEFLQRLRECLPENGSVVAYNAGFEQSRLTECSQLYPQYQRWLASVLPRFVDLLKPFRDFRYCASGQNGSASMKAVLPVLTGRTYDHLVIQEGGTASLEFMRVTYTDVSEPERQRARQGLELYCSQDTLGMVWIIEALQKLIAE